MFHASIDDINTDLERLLAVTGDDVKRVAGAYLDPANLTLVIVKPGAGGAQ
jgi:predicted Zn-dependent peptidase